MTPDVSPGHRIDVVSNKEACHENARRRRSIRRSRCIAGLGRSDHIGGNMVNLTRLGERVVEPADIHHPLHPLHHLVLNEFEAWAVSHEEWQDFPESPDALYALQWRRPELTVTCRGRR
jgi:hypothetical protein